MKYNCETCMNRKSSLCNQCIAENKEGSRPSKYYPKPLEIKWQTVDLSSVIEWYAKGFGEVVKDYNYYIDTNKRTVIFELFTEETPVPIEERKVIDNGDTALDRRTSKD